MDRDLKNGFYLFHIACTVRTVLSIRPLPSCSFYMDCNKNILNLSVCRIVAIDLI
jgi:hypothetical protein